MKLLQVKGNTWIADGMGLIPFYKLDDHRCILLDTGAREEREELEEALLSAGLTPAGILCSHAHSDHCASNRYFQEKYHIPVALTAPEAGMCTNVLALKCYFLTISPGTVEEEASCMVHTPDVLIPPTDGLFSFAGADFQIVHTPGHSAGHVSTITPDRVCYTGDALLSYEYLNSKLPYSLSHAQAAVSRERFRNLDCDVYVMAHRGICSAEEIHDLVDCNQTMFQHRAEEVLSVVTGPMTASQIGQAICQLHQLFTRKARRALRFERDVRLFIEYLTDRGDLILESRRGVTFYRPAHPIEEE